MPGSAKEKANGRSTSHLLFNDNVKIESEHEQMRAKHSREPACSFPTLPRLFTQSFLWPEVAADTPKK
jgi:hypothetical protein